MINFPLENKLPVEKLNAVFNDTTNSYKFYWFLAFLDEVVDTEKDELTFTSLIQRMVSKVWYPLTYYKLSFGKADGFVKIADYILDKTDIDNSVNSDDVFSQLKTKLNEHDMKSVHQQVLSLTRWVPYRFIRPFFAKEIRGLKDSQVNKAIELIAKERVELNSGVCPYYIKKDAIVLSKEWKAYLIKNKSVLQSYTYWYLCKYLHKHNPNVIGIPGKLFKPLKRDLKKSADAWHFFLKSGREIRCIYTNDLIPANFSLDHFIPWSYVVHDLNWNLIPVKKEVNSKKGSCLPDLDEYLDLFIAIQYEFVKTIVESNNFKDIIEQYCILFNCGEEYLSTIPHEIFRTRFTDTLKPMEQIASNMGFIKGWTYKV